MTAKTRAAHGPQVPGASGDALIVPHLVYALDVHRKWCRSRGVRSPPALDALLVALAASAGQERPGVDAVPSSVEAGAVPTPLLLDDRAAAERLGVSARTVRRLRAGGALPSILVGKQRRIRVTDLEAFAANGGTA